MADWAKIKAEYITTDTSYRKLAQKYGISDVQIAKVGKQEGWVELRKQHMGKTLAKILEADAKKKVERYVRVQKAGDILMDKIEQAIKELDIQLYKEVHKEKVIEYGNKLRPDKPTKEVVKETEKLLDMVSIVDRMGLKQVASALKDVTEIQMLQSELDNQEQEARIANLQRQAAKDADTDDVTIALEGEVAAYGE